MPISLREAAQLALTVALFLVQCKILTLKTHHDFHPFTTVYTMQQVYHCVYQAAGRVPSPLPPC